jgi:hypothetical protein
VFTNQSLGRKTGFSDEKMLVDALKKEEKERKK